MQIKPLVFGAVLALQATTAVAEKGKPKIYFPRHIKRQFTNSTLTSQETFPFPESTPLSSESDTSFVTSLRQDDESDLVSSDSPDEPAAEDPNTAVVEETVSVPVSAAPAQETPEDEPVARESDDTVEEELPVSEPPIPSESSPSVAPPASSSSSSSSGGGLLDPVVSPVLSGVTGILPGGSESASTPVAEAEPSDAVSSEAVPPEEAVTSDEAAVPSNVVSSEAVPEDAVPSNEAVVSSGVVPSEALTTEPEIVTSDEVVEPAPSSSSNPGLLDPIVSPVVSGVTEILPGGSESASTPLAEAEPSGPVPSNSAPVEEESNVGEEASSPPVSSSGGLLDPIVSPIVSAVTDDVLPPGPSNESESTPVSDDLEGSSTSEAGPTESAGGILPSISDVLPSISEVLPDPSSPVEPPVSSNATDDDLPEETRLPISESDLDPLPDETSIPVEIPSESPIPEESFPPPSGTIDDGLPIASESLVVPSDDVTSSINDTTSEPSADLPEASADLPEPSATVSDPIEPIPPVPSPETSSPPPPVDEPSSQPPPVTTRPPTTVPSASWMPSVIIEQSSTTSSSTSASGAPPTPSDTQLPEVISPGDASDITRPAGTVELQVGFDNAENYRFVSDNPMAAAQIFTYLPQGLAHAAGVDVDKITVYRLVPFNTTDALGYVTTLARFYYPETLVDQLRMDIKIPSSALYNHPQDIVSNLTAKINPDIDIIPGRESLSGLDNDDDSSDSDDNGGDLFDNDESESTPMQRGTAAAIGIGAVGVAAAFGAAMFLVARRYKQKRQGHRRASSISNSSEMRYAGTGSPAMMGGALLSHDYSNYGGVAGGRNSHGSGRSGANHSVRTAGISAPVAAENSLGWN